MSTTTCLSCRAETTNGLALCELCQRLASDCLDFVPVYFRNLGRWKPGRAGSRPVPGSRVLYDGPRDDRPVDRVVRALEDAGNAITTWVRSLADDRGVEIPETATEVDQIAACCRLLAGHLTSIATLEWCGEFVKQLQRQERTLSALTEDVVPGWYAGACGRLVTMEGERCPAGVYVVPGLTWVTCRACGSTTHAADRLDVVLEEARSWVATPKLLAEALVALIATESSVLRLRNRITQWGKRGRVQVVQHMEANDFGVLVPRGPKRYRLGDVLDTLRTEGQTRGKEKADAVPAIG